MTQKIAESEKKSNSYKESRLDSLSEKKEEKIKKFAKQSIAQTIHRMRKAGKLASSSSTSTAHDTPSTSMPTPNSHDGEPHVQLNFNPADDDIEMEVDYGSEDDYEETGEKEHGELVRMPPPEWSGWQDASMDIEDAHSASLGAADPRRRPPINS